VSAQVVPLLGVLCYGALLAFDNHAADAHLAPDLRRRAAMSELAAAEMTHFAALADRLRELGAAPEDAMAPFATALDRYHASTRPRDWLESLVKAYVGDSIADDFYREVAAGLAEPDRSVVLAVLHDDRHARFAVTEVRAATETDTTLASRLALWGRRLAGQAVGQATATVEANPSLRTLLADQEPGGGFEALVERLAAAHADRMALIGLQN
jgi:hypothetical protein